MDIFKKLHSEGQTIIMVTHEVEYSKYAERIIHLDNGQIISDERV
jgi:energy-coupling factor transporter ATP-binding protein EcfA2